MLTRYHMTFFHLRGTGKFGQVPDYKGLTWGESLCGAHKQTHQNPNALSHTTFQEAVLES